MKKRILIAGGSGLIGNAIVKAASPLGWECIILSRSAGPGKIQWSPADYKIELHEAQEFDAIINLAGENVSEGRWTEQRKDEVYNSRMNSTATLISFLKKGLLKTQCYIGASAIGIYGNRDEHSVDETAPVQQGHDWFIKTVIDWEEKHREIAALPIRTAIFRIGIVLSGEGGALHEILKKAKPGILPVFGSGDQIWSWIHISDLVKMIMFAIEHREISGTYNATAPVAVSNNELIHVIQKKLKTKKIITHVPKFMMALILGEMHRVLFDSSDVSSDKIQSAGFNFDFKTIAPAIQDLIGE